MRDEVSIVEVSLRDGLQNEPVVVPLEHKLAHLDRLLAAGCKDIEVTSFVRADRIPALADASALMAALPPRRDVRYWVLVPNPVGMDRALAAGARHVAAFMSVSETHNRRNINRSVRDSLADTAQILRLASDDGVPVRTYLSAVFGCPYEGPQALDRVVDLVVRLHELGATRVVLGDTIGLGTPADVSRVVSAILAAGVPVDRLAMHMHDTRGMAVANVYEAWRLGVRQFDGSVAGIGGCPYAPGASGNAATEDLVFLFQGLGASTGVDLDGLAAAGRGMASVLGRELPGRVHRAMAATWGGLSSTCQVTA
jgi:hydroxymethylglutaryl-CoA lyase